jgi:helix-turn-helix protein
VFVRPVFLLGTPFQEATKMTEIQFVRLEEIAERYQIPISTLRRWCAERRFPVYKISNRIRVSLKEFSLWWEKFHVRGDEK